MLDATTMQKMLDPMFPGLMGARLTELAPDRVVADQHPQCRGQALRGGDPDAVDPVTPNAR